MVTWDGLIITLVIAALCGLGGSLIIFFYVSNTRHKTAKKLAEDIHYSNVGWLIAFVLFLVLVPMRDSIAKPEVICMSISIFGFLFFIPWAYILGSRHYETNKRRYMWFIALAVQAGLSALYFQWIVPVKGLWHMYDFIRFGSYVSFAALITGEIVFLARNKWKIFPHDIR